MLTHSANTVIITLYLLTYSMEQNPSWEANRYSDSQEIPLILWNPKIHYCVHKARHMSIPWARSIQSMPPTYFLNIHINIILPSMPGPSKWSPSFRFPRQNHVCTYLLPHMRHLIHLDLITRIIFGEYRTLSSSLCRLHHSHATSSLLSPNILLNTLFSSTLSLRSSLNMSDQVPNSHKTRGKII